MSHYLIRNVCTGETLGPYLETEVTAILWGKTRDEWMIFKELKGESQSLIERICRRRKRAKEIEGKIDRAVERTEEPLHCPTSSPAPPSAGQGPAQTG